MNLLESMDMMDVMDRRFRWLCVDLVRKCCLDFATLVMDSFLALSTCDQVILSCDWIKGLHTILY
jgi:hypothetical protein